MLLDVLLALVILVCVALVGVILLQRSEGGALGMGGGGPGAFMTARGTGDLLTQTTQVLAGLFFVLCLALTLLSGHNRSASVADRLKINGLDPHSLTPTPAQPAQAPSGQPSLPAPAAETAPPPAQQNSTDPFAATRGAKPQSGGTMNLPAPSR